MDKNVDFSRLSNSEINIKIKGFENEYITKRNKVIELINELVELDKQYINGKNELKKRGALSDE